MESSVLIRKLNENIEVFKSLVISIGDDQDRWNPKPDKWSILEVMHHLYDEEKEDFRLRLISTLENPEKEWNSINPLQWAIDRKYNEQNFTEISNKFFKERKNSLKWLNSLNSPDWNKTYSHPQIGKISAGDLLSSWVTHDFLHMRQLVVLNLEYYKLKSLPFNTKYALP